MDSAQGLIPPAPLSSFNLAPLPPVSSITTLVIVCPSGYSCCETDIDRVIFSPALYTDGHAFSKRTFYKGFVREHHYYYT